MSPAAKANNEECAEMNPHCERRFSSLEDGIGKILENQMTTQERQKDIFDRLFKDNGRKSYQTRLDKVEDFIRFHLWINGIIIVAVVGAVVTWVFKKI